MNKAHLEPTPTTFGPPRSPWRTSCRPRSTWSPAARPCGRGPRSAGRRGRGVASGRLGGPRQLESRGPQVERILPSRRRRPATLWLVARSRSPPTVGRVLRPSSKPRAARPFRPGRVGGEHRATPLATLLDHGGPAVGRLHGLAGRRDRGPRQLGDKLDGPRASRTSSTTSAPTAPRSPRPWVRSGRAARRVQAAAPIGGPILRGLRRSPR